MRFPLSASGRALAMRCASDHVRRREHVIRAACTIEPLEQRRLLAFTLTGAPDWIEQGPGPITGGQVEGLGAQNNPVAGAVEALAAHPTNPDILFAATINGGIWRTEDATSASPTWTPLIDLYDSLSMGAIAFDPLDASNNTLYAGYGRYSSGGGDGGRQSGVLRTTDGGDTWSPVDEATFDGLNIRSVLPTTLSTPTGQVVLVAATDGGLFRSVDGGNSFTRQSGAGSGLPLGGVTHLVADPSSNQRYYLARANDGVYRSDDGGVNWNRVNGSGGNTINTAGTANRIELAVHNSGAGNAVYAASIRNGQLDGIFRSVDQGANWVQMDTPATNEGGGNTVGIHPTVKPFIEGHPGAQGRIHFSIVADPADPNLVYVGGDRQARTGPDGIEGTSDDAWPNSIGASNFTGRLFVGDASQPSGSQWTPVTHNGANGTAPHADSRDMIIDANGNILEADDGGIYRLIDPDNSDGNRAWTSVNGDLRVTEFYDVAYDSVNNTIFGGTQDVGSPEQVSAGNASWREVNQGDGATAAVDSTSSPGNSIHYTTSQRLGSFVRRVIDNTNSVVSSSNVGLTVTNAGSNGLRAIDSTVQFINPYVLNSQDPTRMLIGTSFLFESADQGDNLTALGGATDQTSDGIDNDGDGTVDEGDEWQLTGSVGTVSAMAYGGAGNPDAIWVGAGGNLLLRTTAGGSVNTVGAYPGGSPTDIVLDPGDWQTAYVADSNNVYYTDDAGSTWTDLTANLVETAIRSISVFTGPAFDVLMIGSNSGVFRTFLDTAALTGEAFWSEYGLGLANAPVNRLIYDVVDDVLVAGTWGRGAWTIPNVSTTITEESCLIVDGTAGDDTIRLVRNADNPLILEAYLNNDTSTPDFTVELGSLQCIEINGLDGDDDILLDDTNGAIDVPVRIVINGDEGNDTIDAGGTTGDNVSLYGQAGDDTLLGGSGDNLLDGGDGDDVMDGREGADAFFGGDGLDTADYSDRTLNLTITTFDANANDGETGEGDNVDPDVETVLGGSGNDDITGADVANLLVGNDGNDTLRGLAGNDTLEGNAGADVIYGGDDNDLISGNDDDDDLFGEAGDDTISGNAGEDYLDGDVGSDLLAGGDGDDTVFGGDDDDTITGDAGSDQLFGDAGNDLMNGNGGDDEMSGGTGDDTMAGDADNDTMLGDAGHDLMSGDSGDDDMIGGDGNDTMSGDAGYDVMLGDDGTITATASSIPESGGAVLRTVSLASTSAGDDAMSGGQDADAIYGQGGRDTLAGDDGDDYMEGNSGDDSMSGGNGDDDMIGGSSTAGEADGADMMTGDGGHDALVGDNGQIQRTVLPGDVYARYTAGAPAGTGEGLENDAVRRTVTLLNVDTIGGNDTMSGNAGDDTMFGGLGDDTMAGNDGHDDIIGHLGNDTLEGGAGDDGLVGDKGVIIPDLLDGSNATMISSQDHFVSAIIDSAGTRKRFVILEDPTLGGDDLISAGVGDDSVHAGAGRDTVFGEDGNDALFGNEGNDTVRGGNGNDHLFGGFGDDTLNGDAGADIIYGGDGDDSLYADNADDRLIDWFGNFNNFYVTGPGYGARVIIRSPAPPMQDFILNLATGDGSTDPLSEVGLVTPPSPSNSGPGGRA